MDFGEFSYLTVFSEGEASSDGADEASVPATTNEAEDDEEFDRLIKGRFKDAYTRRSQSMINKRFKETKALESFKSRAGELMTKASEYFGVDDDFDSIIGAMEKAPEGDDRRHDPADRELYEAALGAAGEYRRIVDEAERMRELYPSFDLESECRDPRFTAIVAAGAGVKGAYEALHHDEIVAGAMQYAADRVYEAARRGIDAGRGRPTENGAAGSAALDPKKDVSSMTEKDIRRILKRVENGEKITF